MTIKYLNELTREEMDKVYNANDKLQYVIMEGIVEGEMFFISEQIEMISKYLSSWSIGQCNRDQHITVDSHEDFILALSEASEDFSFSLEHTEEIAQARLLVVECQQEEDMDKIEELEYQIERVSQRLANHIRDLYTSILDDYCLDDKNLKSYFYEFYADLRMEGAYIQKGNYTLYEDISYIKSYA